jgi:hypothetical protein
MNSKPATNLNSVTKVGDESETLMKEKEIFFDQAIHESETLMIICLHKKNILANLLEQAKKIRGTYSVIRSVTN